MANAVGTVLGCLVLIILMEERGIDFIKESFPATFTSKWWSWTEGMTLDMTFRRLHEGQSSGCSLTVLLRPSRCRPCPSSFIH